MIEKNRFLSLYPRLVLRRCVFFGSHWNRKWLKSDVSCVCICIYALYTLCEIKTRKKAYMLQETLLSPRSGTEWGGAVWSLFVCYIHADCNRHSLTHSHRMLINIHMSKKSVYASATNIIIIRPCHCSHKYDGKFSQHFYPMNIAYKRIAYIGVVRISIVD